MTIKKLRGFLFAEIEKLEQEQAIEADKHKRGTSKKARNEYLLNFLIVRKRTLMDIRDMIKTKSKTKPH